MPDQRATHRRIKRLNDREVAITAGFLEYQATKRSRASREQQKQEKREEKEGKWVKVERTGREDEESRGTDLNAILDVFAIYADSP